jgi:ribokinase
MSSFDVIGFGAINYDNLLIVDRIVIDGEQVIKKSSVQPGGSAANTIFGLSKLGIKCGFVGAVGSDHEGKSVLKDFTSAGIDTTGIIIKNKTKTGYTICISDQRNNRSIYIKPGANNKIDTEDIDYHYVNLSKILHLSSFVDDSQFRLQSKLVDNISKKVTVSFSPGILYAQKGIDDLLPILNKTGILFATRTEIETMTKSDLLVGAKQCLEAGCKYVVVTMGKGYKENNKYIIGNVFTRDLRYEVSMQEKTILRKTESTGAGDSFAAGFLFGVLNKKDIAECTRIGHITAISTLQKIGSRKGLPDLSLLSAKYSELTGGKLL